MRIIKSILIIILAAAVIWAACVVPGFSRQDIKTNGYFLPPSASKIEKNRTSAPVKRVKGHVDAVYPDHIVINDMSMPRIHGDNSIEAGDEIEMQIDRDTGKVKSIMTIRRSSSTAAK